MRKMSEYLKEFQVRGGPETLSTLRNLGILFQVFVSASSALLYSLTVDRLPLFFESHGRMLLSEVPKFCILTCRPQRETDVYKFPNSWGVY